MLEMTLVSDPWLLTLTERFRHCGCLFYCTRKRKSLLRGARLCRCLLDFVVENYFVGCRYCSFSMSFSSVPVLDLALARNSDTKLAFLADLQTALLDVGFLYIKNTGIDEELVQAVIRNAKGFFNLPAEIKDEVNMVNAPSFLGT